MLTVMTKASLYSVPINHFTFSCVLPAFQIYTNVSRSDVLFWQEEENNISGMNCSLGLRAQLWSKVFPGMQTIKTHRYDSSYYIVFSNCCFTLLNYKCKTVKDMNDSNIRNKNIRHLNIDISSKAMLSFLKPARANTRLGFLLPAASRVLAWSKCAGAPAGI